MKQTEINKLLDQYLQNTISEEDLHLLEKQALHDDFLFEALQSKENFEGQIPVDDVRDRLLLRVRAKRKRNWMPLIAASTIGLAIMTVLFIYQRTSYQSQDSYAELPINQEEQYAESFELEKNGEMLEEQMNYPGTEEKPQQNKAISRKAVKKSSKTEVKPEQQDAIEQSKTIVQQVPAEDDSGMKDEAAQADLAFSEQAESMPMESSSHVQITENNEVSVAARKVPASAKRSKSSVRSRPIAIPVDGWVKYNSRLQDRLIRTESAIRAGISGDIILSFEVNQAGEAINIHVTKSLGFGLDELAIQILKTQGKWKKGQGELTLSFK